MIDTEQFEPGNFLDKNLSGITPDEVDRFRRERLLSAVDSSPSLTNSYANDAN